MWDNKRDFGKQYKRIQSPEKQVQNESKEDRRNHEKFILTIKYRHILNDRLLILFPEFQNVAT